MSRRTLYWIRAFAWAVIAGFATSIAVELVATLVMDPTCSRGLCDSDLFGSFKLATRWLPMAVAIFAVLIPAWLWRPRN
jgi:hypothetical protein